MQQDMTEQNNKKRIHVAYTKIQTAINTSIFMKCWERFERLALEQGTVIGPTRFLDDLHSVLHPGIAILRLLRICNM